MCLWWGGALGDVGGVRGIGSIRGLGGLGVSRVYRGLKYVILKHVWLTMSANSSITYHILKC